MNDFELYYAHIKGIWLARDIQGHDILYRRKIIGLEPMKYEWVIDDDVNIYYKIKNRLLAINNDLKIVKSQDSCLDAKRMAWLIMLSQDYDFKMLLDLCTEEFCGDSFNYLKKIIIELQVNYQSAILQVNQQNEPFLVTSIKRVYQFSSQPEEDAQDILQDTNLAIIKNLQRPDYLYPIIKTYGHFNAYFKKIALNSWFILIKKRKKESIFYYEQSHSEIEVDETKIFDEESHTLDGLSILMEKYIDIKILVELVKIDTEAANLKRTKEWSEREKDEFIWTQKKLLLQNINYQSRLLELLPPALFKKRGEAYLRKKKELGIKKIEELFGKKVAFNPRNKKNAVKRRAV